MNSLPLSKEQILDVLREIPDPEIPVIDIYELGILKNIILKGEEVEVIITPTYSGCPAMKQIESDIVNKLKEKGIQKSKVTMVYQPAWTTDWINDEAKEKLRKYGIAPPPNSTQDKGALLGKPKMVACPQCGSANTEMVSQFGSTACKALYKCINCKEPFDYFKCI